MDLVNRARVFATAAHEAVNQRRKYTLEPYIVHPTEVAEIVSTVPHTQEQLAAAFLHDVLEDTNVTESELRQEFGDAVTDLVVWLSDVSRPEDGNRKARKEKDRQHTADAPAEAQTVKLGDLISNTKSIVKHDLKFAKTYLQEKKLLLEVLTKGDKQLWNRAYQLLQEGETDLALQNCK